MRKSNLAYLLLLSGGLIYVFCINFCYFIHGNYRLIPLWPKLNRFNLAVICLMPCLIAPTIALRKYLQVKNPKRLDLIRPLLSLFLALLPMLLLFFAVIDEDSSSLDGRYRKAGGSFAFMFYPLYIVAGSVLGFVGDFAGKVISRKITAADQSA